MTGSANQGEAGAAPASPPDGHSACEPRTDVYEVDRALVEHTTRIPLSFNFICFGLPFTAMVVVASDGARVKLVGDFGPLPAEADRISARDTVNAVVAKGAIRPNARFVLSQSQRIMFVGGKFTGTQPTPIETLITVAGCLATAKPLFDVMRVCLAQKDSAPGR